MVVAVIGIGILLLLIILGIPIALALFFVGFVGITYLRNIDVANSISLLSPLGALLGDVTALPLFILIGSFALASGIASEGYVTAKHWLGRLPGGLGLTTIAASSLFAACSGSSVASAAAMGKLSIPEMIANKYKDTMVAGIVGAGGLLAVMIPPSGLMVLYGMITGESISDLLMAGIVPGIILASAFMLGIVIKAKMDPGSMPTATEEYTLKEKLSALKGVIGIFIIFGIIFIGLFTGIFTTTESAAFGALVALILLIVKGYKANFKKKFLKACMESAEMNISVFFLMLSAYVFSAFLVQAGLPQTLSTIINQAGLHPMAILFIILASYFVLGMFLESVAIVLLTVPIYYPILMAAGFDGVWFGVILVCMIEIGMLTPPFGIIAFTIKSIAPDINIVRVFKGAALFVGIQLAVVLLMVFIPDIALWLPSLMN